jgi:DNA-binding MarR family transcriptional regulator
MLADEAVASPAGAAMSGRGKRGSHRKGDEAFLMLTLSMARNPAILELSPIAAKALHLFYRAHIHASIDDKVWFPMPRRWIVKMLGVSMSTADRVLAELETAGLIVQQRKRALRKPACYRLALPSGDAIPDVY